MLAKRWNQNGKVIILSETTDEPITLAGEMAGKCWAADTASHEKNFKRGLDCLKSGHGRVLEYAQIYMEISGYSARVIREFERHIGGSPTYLQESTRYVLDENFGFITPPSIKNNNEANTVYNNVMNTIAYGIEELKKNGTPKEDISMMLPLGMETKIVHRTNLRNLIDMSRVRLCSRAYWEYRQLMKDILESLSIYSDEWEYLIKEERIFKPKCEDAGYCNEKFSCGYINKIQKDNNKLTEDQKQLIEYGKEHLNEYWSVYHLRYNEKTGKIVKDE
jgi:thymidylate synthase (FAD)